MSVLNQIPESNYIGNGTTKTFAANFEYASDSDVFVTVNGIAPEIGQATFANGVFTFTAAPANGAAIRVYRSTPVERDTEYDNHDNVFRPRVVNIDFDRIWLVLQEYLMNLGITNQVIAKEIADRILADQQIMQHIATQISNVTTDYITRDLELKDDYIQRDQINRNALELQISATNNALSTEANERKSNDDSIITDYILRDETLRNYIDQTLGALLDLPDFQGIEAQFVKDASGENQQDINDYNGAKWRNKAGGYALNSRVMLDNGDIVRSTVAGNTVDPNVDMTGWEFADAALNSQKLKRENVSVWDFFTKSELATYKAAPTVFNAYRPIKEFFDYIAANDVRVAYCSGEFYVATGLVLGTGNVRTKLIVGNATFRALNAIDIVLNINAGQDFTWLGMITTFGTGGAGSNSYNSRTCRVGVQISSPGVNSARNKYTAITANNFKEFGVFVNGVGSLSSLGYIRTSNCGSGKTTAGYSLTADFSNPVRSGGAGSISQLVTLDVTQLPPPELASAGGRDLPLHAIINGKPHYVYNIDREANKIGIFPWLPPDQVSGSLIYMFGGGVCVNGGDSSVLGIEMIDAVNCGAAFVTGALYAPVVERIVSQVNGAAVVLGQNPVSAMLGGSIGTLYCEVNNFDLIRVTRSTLSFNILNTVAFDHNKVAFSCATALTTGNYADFDNLSGINIFDKGVLLQYQRSNGSRATGRTFSVTSPNNRDYIYYAGGLTTNLTIDPPNDNYANMYGIYKRRVVVYGSGAGSKPSVVNFDLADSVNYTINSAGSTTASYTSFDGFAVFEIIYRSDTKRFFISQVSNKNTSATVTYNPPSLASGASTTTTVTLTGVSLGAVVQAGFSQYHADIEISASVSDENTVAVKFKNTGAAVVDLASGTLTVKLI